MTYDQLALKERGDAFRQLHKSGIFVMPCAWDPISALLFQGAGFTSVATTSGGVNWGHGRPDYVYGVPRDEMLASYGEIAAATQLPLSGDLENGYGDDPSDAADWGPCLGRSTAPSTQSVERCSMAASRSWRTS